MCVICPSSLADLVFEGRNTGHVHIQLLSHQQCICFLLFFCKHKIEDKHMYVKILQYAYAHLHTKTLISKVSRVCRCK